MEKTMYYAGIVENYYNSACPPYAKNGYDKNILLDTQTEKCIFVSGDVKPNENELLFRCKRSGGETFTTMKTPHQKREKVPAMPPTGNTIYEGRLALTTWDDGKEEIFAYVPEGKHYTLYNQVPMSVKVANLDEFLSMCMEYDDRECNPYQFLQMLDCQSTVQAPFGVPAEYMRLPFKHGENCGNMVFHFLYYELLNAGLVATFEFSGIEDTLQPDEEEYNF